MKRLSRCLVVGVSLSLGLTAYASPTKPRKRAVDWGNLHAPAVPAPAPSMDELEKIFSVSGMVTKDQVEADKKLRELASTGSGKNTATKDQLSPDLVTVRDFLLSVKSAEALDAKLAEWDKPGENGQPSAYDRLAPDARYVIARLAPIRAFRGFLWRMAPLAHQSVMTQVMLLSFVRSFAETLMIYEPDTHWQTYMQFFAIPATWQLQAPNAVDPNNGRQNFAFIVENDLIDFLRTEVRPALTKAIDRLDKLPVTHVVKGKPTYLVFDNKLRFGAEAFDGAGGNQSDYKNVDRFAFIGHAERHAGMARFHRRLAVIAQLSAYNWNGNIALRKEIGLRIGMDEKISSREGDAFSVEGLLRKDRVDLVKKFLDERAPAIATARGEGKAAFNLFELMAPGWMDTAYFHMAKYAYHASESWKLIKASWRNGSNANDWLLDPDLFEGRKEQIDIAVENLKKLLPQEGRPEEVYGAITGEVVNVNLRGILSSAGAPRSLFDLMPTHFNDHQDISKETIDRYQAAGFNLSMDSTSSIVSVVPTERTKRERARTALRQTVRAATRIPLKRKVYGAEFEFRNYLFGRAVGWSTREYSKVFGPVSKPEDVMKKQQILAEVRGARPVLNSLAIFVK